MPALLKSLLDANQTMMREVKLTIVVGYYRNLDILMSCNNLELSLVTRWD